MKTASIPLVAFFVGALACPRALKHAPAEFKFHLATNINARDDKAQYHGDMTYYEVGVGACGHDDSGQGSVQNIVAVSAALMGEGPSTNMCNRKISIKGDNGKEVTAVIRDKCPSCDEGALDVSEKVFKDVVGDLGVGRAKVSWTVI
ncbi:hypothetical protein B0T26DRAFT_757343 [Lasiosphaeria miniovina]|uniref:RlpA-like protein double-psi beta-barrel domain-containing protein n=1 Tax=Lasiosphaeria miniovina TaxID=1954250 RepID=A0AA40DL47_9PEZI|nr:uncharacterized protein B0T26DRAFT_757343 [Lasiosphaeria miniovina]KAK0703848.1 hypothetical protein B0T26DRAFT_757343 [Lasiosphaeria miniovina]